MGTHYDVKEYGGPQDRETSSPAYVTPDRRARRRTLLHRFIGLTFARAVGALAHAGALLLAARWSGPSDFGAMSVALSVVVTASGVLSFGLPTFALRAAALRRDHAVGFASFLNLATSALLVLVGVAVILVVEVHNMVMVIALCVALAVEKNSELRVGLGTEFGQARLVNGVVAARGLIVLVVVAASHALGLNILTGYAMARLISSTLGSLLLTARVRGWPLAVQRPRDGSLESLGGLAVANSIGSLRQFDVSLVGLAGGLGAAGVYGAIQKLISPVQLLSSSLSVVVMGPATRAGISGVRRAVRLVALLSIALLVAMAILSIFSRNLVELFLGGEFASGAGALTWGLMSVPAMGCFPVVATLMQASGRARAVAWNTAFTTAAFLVAVPVGAITAGAVGAAASFSMTTWLRFASLVVLGLWGRASEALNDPRGKPNGLTDQSMAHDFDRPDG